MLENLESIAVTAGKIPVSNHFDTDHQNDASGMDANSQTAHRKAPILTAYSV